VKQKYKSGDLLVAQNGDIVEVLAHDISEPFYLCQLEIEGRAYIEWLSDYWTDRQEKIGRL